MRRCFSLLLTLLCVPLPGLGLAAGCGQTVIVDDPAAGGGGGEAGAPPVQNGEGGEDAGTVPLEEYEDPGCPDVEPITDFACDPYDQSSGFCAPGDGCFIYVQYPAEPCGQEIYGAFCAPAGPGGQGDPCSGGGECGAGFACVVTGSGTQCVQLCELSGDGRCSPGLVCEPIDVAGMGGCL